MVSKGRPFRIFFAFDPKRQAVLLVGGNKEGDERFYERMIPWADQLFSEYLSSLEKEESPKAKGKKEKLHGSKKK